MKKLSFLIILISVLFLGITNVNAEAGGKLYSISTYVNSVKNSEMIYEETEEFQLANGNVYVKGSNVSIDNLSNAEYISIENYSGELGMTLNITLSGNNTVEAFKWNGFSGKINISGNGSLRFKPVSGVGTTEIPSLENAGIVSYYVEDVEEQKNEVARMIQTSLPISYDDGYVCINCNVESPKEDTKNQQSNVGFIIGGIVLTIAVIAAGSFVYLKRKKK